MNLQQLFIVKVSQKLGYSQYKYDSLQFQNDIQNVSR